MARTTAFVLAALSATAGVFAATNANEGDACNPANNRLNPNTFNFVTDCGPTTWCNPSTSKCEKKGCRRDIYPFGYAGVAYDQLPPLCPEGQFCPDEGSTCFTQQPPGGPCQKDRDEQCSPPPNMKDLAHFTNINGSVCLNFQCYHADVNTGQTCVNDNTLYEGTADDGTPFAYVISRDNCRKTLYCDAATLQCHPKINRGHPCNGDKECLSYNCIRKSQNEPGVCGKAADEPLKPRTWVYVVIGLAIVIALIGVMLGLWLLHRRAREENQVKLQEYYNEQIAYRQSIMSMSHAKNSLLSLPANTTPGAARSSLLGHDDSVGYATANDALLPPNVRRENSGFSDDSEVLLGNEGRPTPRFRG